jgi:hypothetical protein
MLRVSWGCGCLVLVAFAGCGPITYINHVTMQASRAVKRAEAAKADELAPYEFTMAAEHLHKARELAGYSRFQEAVAFGKTAQKFGREAEQKALDQVHGRGPRGTPPDDGGFKPREERGE